MRRFYVCLICVLLALTSCNKGGDERMSAPDDEGDDRRSQVAKGDVGQQDNAATDPKATISSSEPKLPTREPKTGSEAQPLEMTAPQPLEAKVDPKPKQPLTIRSGAKATIKRSQVGTKAKTPIKIAPQASATATADVEKKSAPLNTGIKVKPLNTSPPAALPGLNQSAEVSDVIHDTEDPEGEPHLVRVFYGTDRKVSGTLSEPGHSPSWLKTRGTWLIGILAAATLTIMARRFPINAVTLTMGLAVVILVGGFSIYTWLQEGQTASKEGPHYSAERGELQVGMCEVTIPRTHEVGELESKSILKLELTEQAERHIVLRRVQPLVDATFYDALRRRVRMSDEKELFVFVHGYNVSFENAARRTAQMAFDLKYKGAAVFFSWPSQGNLLGYTVDENNVRWSIPHLVQFLESVIAESEARSISVIAHSMGNRALTAAVQQLSQRLEGDRRAFEHIVLAAPDIDADVFRRDLVPALRAAANRVTLYASSQDRALQASRQVHGHPRAGDSGENIVVVPGVDTIDVSEIDTSLLGHSYYGSNDLILTDLGVLLNDSAPADQRHWLRPVDHDGLRYWSIDEPRTAQLPE